MDPTLPFDRALVMENLGGDEELFKQIALAFIADWPRREENLRNALAAGAAEPLRSAAHAIKGAVGNFAADQAFEAARSLEKSCKAGNLGDAPLQVETVLESVDALLAALHAELRQAP